MTIRHLKIFVMVCQEKSITKAGKKLFMAQPTVSVAISELEKHYNIQLFDRISKKLYLTEAGSRLLPYAQHMVALFEEMEMGAQAWGGAQLLHIGASVTIGNCLLPDYLKRLKCVHPEIQVKAEVNNSEKLEQGILENQIDIALMEGIPHSNHLNKSAFKEDELVLLFAPSHPWRFQSVIEPEALRKEPFFMREKGSGGREVLESALLLQGIEIQPAWESISTQAIISGVENGLGVTVLPFLLAKPSLDQGKLLTRPITGLALRRRLYIIWHKNKYVTEAMRDFMQICRDMP